MTDSAVQNRDQHAPERYGPTSTLFTFEFISLNLTVFFGFCNLAMFYGFYTYLGRIGIPAGWRGFLVGLEPMTAFAVRLALIPLLHAGNSFRVMLVSLALILAALCGYQYTTALPGLIALRVVHGAGFVLLVSAATVILVRLIPEGRSGQGFAMMSIAWLVPYAVVPTVCDMLARYFHNEAELYARFSILIVPGVVVLLAAKRRVERRLAGAHQSRKPPMADCLLVLRQPPTRWILAIAFTLFFSNTTVFFFVQEFLLRSGTGKAGAFLSASTGAVIVTRVFGGRLLDRIEKWKLLAAFLPPFIACLWLISRVPPPALPALAIVFGICLGVLFPVISASMFLISPPHLRGANSNVVQLVMDLGYFVSPSLAGALLGRGVAFGRLFDLCALLVAGGLIPLMLLRGAIPAGTRKEVAA